MTFTEAKRILELHNLWRRDNHVPSKYEMVNPTELGIAIDTAVDALNACINSDCESSEEVTDLYRYLQYIKYKHDID